MDPEYKMIREVRQALEAFLRNTPQYYLKSIRQELRKLNIPTAPLNDCFKFTFPQSIVEYINKVMNSARETLALFQNNLTEHKPSINVLKPLSVASVNKIDVRKALLNQKIRATIITSRLNPFDIQTREVIPNFNGLLRSYLSRDRNLMKNYLEEDSKHNVCISKMGDYQSRVKPINLDRVVDPSSIRPTTFGSPFKTRSFNEFNANEADIQLFNHIENSKGMLFRARMERRRKKFRIRPLKTSNKKAMSRDEVNSGDKFPINDRNKKRNQLRLRYFLHIRPYSRYLHKCYQELRKDNPDINVLQCLVKKCQKCVPIMVLILKCVKEEALMFNNRKFVRYINKKLSSLYKKT
ncbi:hypothetical protein RF11_09906 [Thelohanellus kitauei]|uniref:Uncharacterized protein n=1 Tax=Thelohanellus kitauei TaxID=669202 RepID=A0A0C2MYM6_THEKT|nr:hypothetical protein RF11_09906 [Thelohanellus kitauei]